MPAKTSQVFNERKVFLSFAGQILIQALVGYEARVDRIDRIPITCFVDDKIHLQGKYV